jgi:EmrB/QacA subfamily drug resistance transporter
MEQQTKSEVPAAGGGWNASQPAMTLPGGRAVNPWLTLVALMFGFFMSLLDATIVNIALSDIQAKLKTDLTTVSWVINAYSLVFTVLLVTTGRLADQFGRKRMFMIGMVLFSLGSLLCAVAPTIEWLIAFRALQAIGAAALNPVSLAIITAVFPPTKRGSAIAVWGASAGLAAALGPIIGGVLVQNFDWRWIFFVNLPFCVIGLFLVYRFVPESKNPHATTVIDIWGFLTLSAGLFCLVFAIIQGNDWGWTSVGILSLFAVAIVALVAFYFVEIRQSQPILDFKMFKVRSFSAGNIATFMFSMALQGAFLILVLYLINAQGYKQLDAAYALLPLPLSSFFVSAASGKLGSKFGIRRMAGLGMFVLCVGMFLLCTLNTDSGYIDVAWRCLIVGFGMGLCFTTFPSIVVSEVPRHQLGVASGAFNTFRQAGFVLGVAILISLFSGQIKDNVAQARTDAVALVKASPNVPDQVKNGFIASLQDPNNQGRPASQGGQATSPAIAALGQQIETRFKKATVDAFTVTWFASGVFALLGLIPVFFLRTPKALRQEASEPGMVAGMH